MYKNYPINNSCLFRLRSKKKLATILNVDEKLMRNNNYREIIQYSIFQNDKGRWIYNPAYELKALQKQLLKYFSRISTPSYLKSGKKGVSYIDNAKSHLYNDYIVTADISGFYSNCRRKNVYEMFINKFEMERDISGIITDIVCYENFIPTGSPTSQMVAYFTYSDAFDSIENISNASNIAFSLYVDDMTFSSKNLISKKYIHEIDTIIRKKGLKLKNSKTKYFFKNDNALITGAVKDSSSNLRVPNKLRLSIIKSYIEYQKASSVEKSKLFNELNGKIRAARIIEADIFPSLKL